MTRLIDVDAVISGVKNRCIGQNDVVKVEHSIISMLYMMPTIDAVPSETLYDFIKELGSITYGKERFFRQDNGTWYDREHADYITLDDVIRRTVNAVRELDDSELFQREIWDRECEDD